MYNPLFDFDHDGELDFHERAAAYEYEECFYEHDDSNDSFDDEEEDVFGDVGLDYEELEMMDPDERREALEDAGLDPEDYDF